MRILSRRCLPPECVFVKDSYLADEGRASAKEGEGRRGRGYERGSNLEPIFRKGGTLSILRDTREIGGCNLERFFKDWSSGEEAEEEERDGEERAKRLKIITLITQEP